MNRRTLLQGAAVCSICLVGGSFTGRGGVIEPRGISGAPAVAFQVSSERERDIRSNMQGSTTPSTEMKGGHLSSSATEGELIIYEAKDCAVSQRFHQETEADYKTSKGGQIFPLRSVDTANGTGGVRLVQPITMTPTFVFADNGVEIGRFTGYPGHEYFLKLLDAAADEFVKMKSAQ